MKNSYEFDSPILRARRARKIRLLGIFRAVKHPQQPVHQVHIKIQN